MKYTYEQYEAFFFLHKLLPLLEKKRNFTERLWSLNEQKEEGLLVPIDAKKYEKNSRAYLRKVFPGFLKELEKQGNLYLAQPKQQQQQNIHYLADILQLKPQEEKMLLLLNANINNHVLLDVEREFLTGDIGATSDSLELAAQVPAGCGFIFLKEDAPLRQFGLIEKKRYDNDFRLTYWARNFINTTYPDEQTRYAQLLGNALEGERLLQGKDFAYIEAAQLALRLMKQAPHTKGFNILLYGAPGTGKTSFAQLLARSAKLSLYPVGICNEGDDERNFRLRQFYRKQFLLKNIKNTCLLFDEGEDMFSSVETRTSKMEINNLLENNEVPVIWTTNKIHRMDPAFIRRFTLAVNFGKPPVEIRQKIWTRYLREQKIPFTPTDTLQ